MSKTAGHYWLHESGGVRPRPTRPRPALRLSLAEREEIFDEGLFDQILRSLTVHERDPELVNGGEGQHLVGRP